MTAVEILFSFTTPSTEPAIFALAATKDVYGIRRLTFDHAARTLRVEYDATRLTPSAVAKLVRQAGLEIAPETIPQTAQELPSIPAESAPTPAPAS